MSGGSHFHNGADRRPWLIISKREAEALLPLIRDQLATTPPTDNPDLRRAARVIGLQLLYIEDGRGHDLGITDALIRDIRA